MALTTPRPTLLTDPGNLFRAPLGTALPANTVAGGVFTDLWSAVPAWVQMGMTTSGTDISTTLTVNPIELAESLDPVAYRTVSRANMVSFALASITATNMAQAMNGALTTVTGTGATTLTRVTPPLPGTEVRCMIGWESLDATVRWFGYQVVNSGTISVKMNKAPAHSDIPWTGMLEVPASTGIPSEFFFAGVARG